METSEPAKKEPRNTSQAAKALGVSRNTLLRWLRSGRISEPPRDFRGWRQFAEADIERIHRELMNGPETLHTPTKKEFRAPPSGLTTFLRQVPLFSSLTDGDLDALGRVAEFRGYKRGSILCHEGQPVEGLHVLLKGRIKLCKHSPEGREQILEIVEPVSTFAETALFDRTRRYPALVRAAAISSTLTIPRRPLQRLLEGRPSLSLAFLGAFAERMKAMMRKVEEATFLTVDERLARYLLGRQRNGVIEGIKLAEVAAIIGAARESVSRAIGRWSRAGYVTLRPGRLLIMDQEGLTRLA